MDIDILNPGIIVFGAAGIDYIAEVPCFPDKDSKIRTSAAKLLVGGNAANTSAALARLGMRCRLLSKVGSDANATFLLESLKHEMGVIVDDVISGCTDCVVTTTAFTYVIVCKESMSRTCIHTPLLFDITHDEVLQNVQQAEFHHDFRYVHFDSRHTESAVLFAEKIRTSNVFQNYGMTFSIDLEKPRPYIDNLICYCNIIFTNKKGIKNMFPTFIGESENDYILQASTFFSYECCKLVVITDGSNGSTVIFADLRHNTKRSEGIEGRSKELTYAGVCYQHLVGEISHTSGSHTCPELVACFDIIAQNILAVEYETCINCNAMNNAGLGVIRCSSFNINSADIVDTTGAGDAFIGGFLFGTMQRFSLQECMILGTVVATEKLYTLGAQTNLPSLERVLDAIATRASGTYIITYSD